MRWVKIPGWEYYDVSDSGLVRRRGGTPRCRFDRLMTILSDKDGYPVVHLRMDGRNRHFPIHLAILLAFAGPKPSPIHQGAHWDGNIKNCTLGNLRWATPKENCDDRNRHGRHARGENHARAKLRDADIPIIKNLLPTLSPAEIAEKFGCSRTLIRLVAIGDRVASHE